MYMSGFALKIKNEVVFANERQRFHRCARTARGIISAPDGMDQLKILTGIHGPIAFNFLQRRADEKPLRAMRGGNTAGETSWFASSRLR
jgi:hypothetical protein